MARLVRETENEKIAVVLDNAGFHHAKAVHRPCGSCAARVCTGCGAPSHRAPPGPHRRGRCPADLVRRHFAAFRPNELWVADITYVRTFSGWVRVALNHRRALQADHGLADLHEPVHGPGRWRTENGRLGAQARGRRPDWPGSTTATAGCSTGPSATGRPWPSARRSPRWAPGGLLSALLRPGPRCPRRRVVRCRRWTGTGHRGGAGPPGVAALAVLARLDRLPRGAGRVVGAPCARWWPRPPMRPARTGPVTKAVQRGAPCRVGTWVKPTTRRRSAPGGGGSRGACGPPGGPPAGSPAAAGSSRKSPAPASKRLGPPRGADPPLDPGAASEIDLLEGGRDRAAQVKWTGPVLHPGLGQDGAHPARAPQLLPCAGRCIRRTSGRGAHTAPP